MSTSREQGRLEGRPNDQALGALNQWARMFFPFIGGLCLLGLGLVVLYAREGRWGYAAAGVVGTSLLAIGLVLGARRYRDMRRHAAGTDVQLGPMTERAWLVRAVRERRSLSDEERPRARAATRTVLWGRSRRLVTGVGSVATLLQVAHSLATARHVPLVAIVLVALLAVMACVSLYLLLWQFRMRKWLTGNDITVP